MEPFITGLTYNVKKNVISFARAIRDSISESCEHEFTIRASASTRRFKFNYNYEFYERPINHLGTFEFLNLYYGKDTVSIIINQL